jgi:pimeloyl-ACP methyl ester carboxylesterase
MTTSTTLRTRFATSSDGTDIAYEVTGTGPALVLVDGALCHRAMGPSRGLAAELASRFTVFAYDRRGRGESGPGSSAYRPDRELEDLAAVVAATGGTAHLLGTSSGAALALEAARQGLPIRRLVGYEAPFILDGTHPANDPDLPRTLQRMVDEGRRGAAVRTFLRTVGAPAPVVALMRLSPAWKRLTTVAHTLPYDLSLVIDHEQGRPLPEGYLAGVGCEALLLAGGKSPAYLRNAQAAIADALPHGRLEVLPGQTHMVKPRVVGPVVASFLAG